MEKRKISYRNFRDFAANLSVLFENMVDRGRVDAEYYGVSMVRLNQGKLNSHLLERLSTNFILPYFSLSL